MQRVLFLPDWCCRPFSTESVRQRHRRTVRSTYLWPDDDGSIVLSNIMRISVMRSYYATYRHATAVDIDSKRLAFASDEEEALGKFQCRFHVYRKEKEIREKQRLNKTALLKRLSGGCLFWRTEIMPPHCSSLGSYYKCECNVWHWLVLKISNDEILRRVLHTWAPFLS